MKPTIVLNKCHIQINQMKDSFITQSKLPKDKVKIIQAWVQNLLKNSVAWSNALFKEIRLKLASHKVIKGYQV
jgi:hypothetical protein